MNPQQEQQTQAPPNLINEDILRKVVEEMEAANPYGMGKYSDEDAAGLGIDSLGSLRLANQLVKAWWGSPMIPRWIQDAPNPTGTFVACVLRGKELGFKMMESLSTLYLSPDGRLGMYGTAMLALMRRSKIHLEFTVMKDDKDVPIGMRVYGKREDGDDYTSEFTIMDAVRANLVESKMQTHKKYPIWMCKWRAVSDLFRTLASDLSGGPMYTREELEDDERARHEEISAELLNGKPAVENPFKVSPKPQPATATENPNLENAKPEPAAEKSEPVKTDTPAPPQDTQPAADSRPADPPAAKPRGRAPKAAPEPEVKPEPETKPEPAQTSSKAEFKASDDDLPKSFGLPTQFVPHETVIQEIPQDQRFVILMGKLAAHMGKPVPECRAVRDEFLRSFMGHSGPLPKPPSDKYVMVLPWLEAIIEHKCDSLVNDPHALGLNVVVGVGQFVRFIDAWQAETKAIATKAALSRCPHTGGKDLIGWLEMVQADGPLSPADLRVALRVFGISGAATSAVLDAAQSRGVTLAAVVGDLDLSTATEGQVLTAVASGAAKQVPPTAQSLWED